jgi:hypothetical protein
MKYVSLTFDDGRKDNYTHAFPIMRECGIKGTLFCTTGYIDGTWTKPETWHSAGEPISIDEMKKLQDAGWEIALHGDQHMTDVDDFQIASKKLAKWGFSERPIGFSVPNSNVSQAKLDELIDHAFGSELAYIRMGRNINTRSISAKVLFALYTYCHMQWAFNRFNQHSLMTRENFNQKLIYSIVVRREDDPSMILRFLEKAQDGTYAVLMLHSILPKDDALYGTDAWCWDAKRFETLCDGLKKMEMQGEARYVTVTEMASKTGESK